MEWRSRLQQAIEAHREAILKFKMRNLQAEKVEGKRVIIDAPVKAMGKNLRKKLKLWAKDAIIQPSKGFRKKAPPKCANFRRFLERKGYIKLGSGCHGSVYGHPKSDRVVKINYSKDCWLDYMVWAHKQGFAGKFAPRLHSFKSYGDFTVSVTDRMTQTVRDAEDSDGFLLLTAFCSVGKANGKKHTLSERVLEENNPGLSSFAKELGSWINKSNHSRDWHADNFMLDKGGRFMVTDPIYGLASGSFNAKRIRLIGTELKIQ